MFTNSSQDDLLVLEVVITNQLNAWNSLPVVIILPQEVKMALFIYGVLPVSLMHCTSRIA